MKLFSFFPRLGVLSALALMIVLPVSAETRTFTDQQGRKIEAEITAVAGTKVTLRLANGKSYTIPIEKLSKADQLYVKVWDEMEKDSGGGTDAGKDDGPDKPAPVIPDNVNYDIEINVDKERTKRGSKVEIDSGESRTDEWVFAVELENSSRVKLEGLEMSYRVYVDAAATAKMSFETPPKFYGGRVEVDPVADGASVTVKTDAVPLKELELDADYVFRDGSRNDLEDKLEGIWVKLWHGDKKVAEFKSNNSTVKKAEWEDDETADPNAEEE